MLLAEIGWLPSGVYWRVSNPGFTRAQNNRQTGSVSDKSSGLLLLYDLKIKATYGKTFIMLFVSNSSVGIVGNYKSPAL